jgi:DNA adenine methylase
MILRRLGNKQKLAKEIQQYFPPHKIYIEPFFGAGGMFFNKPKAKYNIVNDLDSDVFNLFQVVMNQKEELVNAFLLMPISEELFNYWKKNREDEPIKKALRFILLSNYGYMGKPDTLHMSINNNSQEILNKIEQTSKMMFDVIISKKDFRKFFNSITYRTEEIEKNKTLIYNDPNYLEVENNYEKKDWKESDVVDLFDCLQKTKCKFAYSEFNHPFILEQAKERNLNVITIGERQNLKNRRIEILVTNYETHPTLF